MTNLGIGQICLIVAVYTQTKETAVLTEQPETQPSKGYFKATTLRDDWVAQWVDVLLHKMDDLGLTPIYMVGGKPWLSNLSSSFHVYTMAPICETTHTVHTH